MSILWFETKTRPETKTAGYREPADLPIEVALRDPLDGEFLYGDDPDDDQLRRFRGKEVGYDRTGRPDKEGTKKDATKKVAGFMVDVSPALQLMQAGWTSVDAREVIEKAQAAYNAYAAQHGLNPIPSRGRLGETGIDIPVEYLDAEHEFMGPSARAYEHFLAKAINEAQEAYVAGGGKTARRKHAQVDNTEIQLLTKKEAYGGPDRPDPYERVEEPFQIGDRVKSKHHLDGPTGTIVEVGLPDGYYEVQWDNTNKSWKGNRSYSRGNMLVKVARRKHAQVDNTEIQLLATQLLGSDPRFKGINSKTHREAIALLLASLHLGLPYAEASDSLFGDYEPITPDLAGAYKFDEVEGYMTSMPVQAPGLTKQQDEQRIKELLSMWSRAQAELAQVKKLFEEAAKVESDLRGEATSIAERLEEKLFEADGLVFDVSHFSRSTPSYKKVIDELIVLFPMLAEKTEELKEKFATQSRIDQIKIKGKVGEEEAVAPKGRSKKKSSFLRRANQIFARSVINTMRAIEKVLDKIISTLRAAGVEEVSKAAQRRFGSRKPETCWTDGLEKHAAEEAGWKEGDQVTDPSGQRRGTLSLTPDGGGKVTFSDGSTATYDSKAMQGGAVKRAGVDPFDVGAPFDPRDLEFGTSRQVGDLLVRRNLNGSWDFVLGNEVKHANDTRRARFLMRAYMEAGTLSPPDQCPFCGTIAKSVEETPGEWPVCPECGAV